MTKRIWNYGGLSQLEEQIYPKPEQNLTYTKTGTKKIEIFCDLIGAGGRLEVSS